MRTIFGLAGTLALGFTAALGMRSAAVDPASSVRGVIPGGPEAVEPFQEGPALLVFLVVDQLPYDLLERFDPAFDGGFRRLRDRGLRFEAMTHDHSITETAPGHATLATGTLPARHGVISNQWWTFGNAGFEMVLNVEDPETTVTESDGLPGASPGVLDRSTLGEWLQDTYSDAKVVSVGGKSRGAILLAGHSEAEVYWFEYTLGQFATSTHYRSRSPAWLRDFNRKVMPDFENDTVWTLAVPEEHRGLARPDASEGEGDGTHLTFPHTFGEARFDFSDLGYWAWWADRPELDQVTLQLALEVMDEEKLGDDDVPDILAISLSQTDRVGHGYGPYSLEQLDNLMRLDRALGEFLDRLDEDVGEGRYLVSLTSDHGALMLPEARAAMGLPGGRLTRDSVAGLQEIVNQASTEAADPASRAELLAEVIQETSWIARAWTQTRLTEDEPADSFAVLEKNSLYPGRMSGLLSRAGVQLQLTEGTLSWVVPFGSTHGSPYHYDRHVPWILYGAGVTPGVRPDRVGAVDVAPTLAGALGVTTPDDLDGVDRMQPPAPDR